MLECQMLNCLTAQLPNAQLHECTNAQKCSNAQKHGRTNVDHDVILRRVTTDVPPVGVQVGVVEFLKGVQGDDVEVGPLGTQGVDQVDLNGVVFADTDQWANVQLVAC